MKNLIFLCVATCIFIFSVIVLNFAPSINGLVGKGHYNLWGNPVDHTDIWGNTEYSFGVADYPCSGYTDEYNDIKDGVTPYIGTQEEKEKYLDQLKDGKNDCLRKKAYIGLEYSAFIIDVIFSFVCAILGLLLYSGNNIGKIVGLIGLASGAVGFVLTFVYIIYSGIVFNNDVVDKDYSSANPYSGLKLATKSDGAVLEWKDNKYVCIFYDKDNKDKLYRKFSNYGVKYLNYFHLNRKDKDDEYYKYTDCTLSSSIDWDDCKKYDEGTSTYRTSKKEMRDSNGNKKGECDKIFITENNGTNEKKKLYDYWVLTIVFGCFIFVLDIGLAIFGFLIFKDSSGSSGAVTIK
jgi:hypothetical protein